jgi:SAM-dependent methyltransferase
MNKMNDYALGHSNQELARLEVQAAVVEPITERLFHRAGLRPGMRVLDIGCGAGDTTMLAARILCGEGQIIGIDSSEAAVAFARVRASRAFVQNITFNQISLKVLPAKCQFDFVFGRYVLFHQSDPLGFLRDAASHLQRGGVLAFHEMDVATQIKITPPIPKLDVLLTDMLASVRMRIPAFDIAGRLVPAFGAAGLPAPDVFCERPAAGRDSGLMVRWWCDTIATFRRLSHPDEPPIDTDVLTAEMKAAVSEGKCQLASLEQWCAWAQL